MSDFWRGIDSITSATGRVREAKNRGAKRGVLGALRNVLNVSNESTPWEEGDLVRDGGISMDEGSFKGAVSYGRSADTKDYAVPQHERMDYKHDPGKGPKFLENAFNSERGKSAEIIAESIRGEFNG